MSETPQFHPEIEKALETSGENIGRVKDIELAKDAAIGENEIRSYEWVPREERIDQLRDDYLKAAIAKRAVRRAAENDLDNLAITGAFDQPNLGINTERLVDEASQVASDYDRVQKLSAFTAEAREHGAEYLDLWSNEDISKALAEAPVYRKNVIKQARPAEVGELVITMKGDTEESRKIAEEGDWVVNNEDGSVFPLTAEKFAKLYEPTEEEGKFRARGMARIMPNPTSKEVGTWQSNWSGGQMQYGDPDGMIAMQYDPSNPDEPSNDRYFLTESEFSTNELLEKAEG